MEKKGLVQVFHLCRIDTQQGQACTQLLATVRLRFLILVSEQRIGPQSMSLDLGKYARDLSDIGIQKMSHEVGSVIGLSLLIDLLPDSPADQRDHQEQPEEG